MTSPMISVFNPLPPCPHLSALAQPLLFLLLRRHPPVAPSLFSGHLAPLPDGKQVLESFDLPSGTDRANFSLARACLHFSAICCGSHALLSEWRDRPERVRHDSHSISVLGREKDEHGFEGSDERGKEDEGNWR